MHHHAYRSYNNIRIVGDWDKFFQAKSSQAKIPKQEMFEVGKIFNEAKKNKDGYKQIALMLDKFGDGAG